MFKEKIIKLIFIYFISIICFLNCSRNSTEPTEPEKPKPANIQVNNNSIDFGTVYIGTSFSTNIKFRNIGDSSLTIDSLKFLNNKNFQTGAKFPIFIKPDSTLEITLLFHCEKKGEVTDSLIIYNNSEYNSILIISLKGFGLLHKLIGGKWIGYEDWGYIFYSSTIYFYDVYYPWGNNVAHSTGFSSGWRKWSLSGNNVKLENEYYTVWEGTINESDSTISGTMRNSSGNSGKWYVKRSFQQ